MCGIAGLVSLDFPKSELAQICVGQLNAIEHRGRCASEVSTFEGCVLGTTRLAIIDIEGGSQPLTSPDGRYTISYNGEVYNYRQLRTELEQDGWIFRTRCDTEVVLAAYSLWGDESCSRLNGMFAFAVWDERLNSLTLVRDRFGIKPLYYWSANGTFAFASQLSGLTSMKMVPRKLDEAAFNEYLALNYVTPPKTLISNISQVRPGATLTVHNGQMKHFKWYSLPTVERGKLSCADVKEEFSFLFERAVKSQLVADVPVGAFLSGGLDSTAIVSVMANEFKVAPCTFAASFREKDYDEGPIASHVANKLGTDHIEEVIEEADWFSLFDETMRYQDSPVADQATIALMALAKRARSRLKVVLTGDGGDELLAGYTTILANRLQPFFGLLPESVIKLVKFIIEKVPAGTGQVSWDFKLRSFLEGVKLSRQDAHATWRLINNQHTIQKILGQGLSYNPASALSAYREAFSNANKALSFDKRAEFADLQVWLVGNNLTRLDAITMGANLEARVPFLDNDLSTFLLAVPFVLKTRGTELKSILRDYLCSQGFSAKVTKRKKVGFHVPIARWFQRGLKKELKERLAAPSILYEKGFLDYDGVNSLLDDHLSGVNNNAFRIFGILVLLSWAEKHL